MSRDGSGVYSKPGGTTAVTGTPVGSSAYNTFCDDLVTDLNAARPITSGGTGATTASGARSNLGVSATDATITAIAALDFSAAGSMMFSTAADTFSLLTTTAAGRALLDDADAAAQRVTLGLVIGTNVQAYDADLTTWAGVTPGTGVATALAVAVGSAGAVVVNGGALGTPSSGTLTSATGLPISTGVSGLGTGIATALAINTGSAGAPVLVNGALGTPSSGTLTNATGLPVGGISGLGTGVATFLATPSSANLAAAVTDETGSGALYFTGGALGTPSSATLTNATGLPVSGITASTSTALGVGSIELGHASDTTLSRVSAGVVAIEGVQVTTNSATQTLTNKTLSSPTLSGTVAGAASWSGLQTFSSRLVAGGTFDPISNVNAAIVVNGAYGGGILFQDTGYGGIWATDSGATLNFKTAGTGSGFGGATGFMRLTASALTLGGVAVPTISSTDTLSNKTLSSPTISGGTITLADAVNIAVDATTGTKIGTATSQKIGFFDKTPVVQPTAVADATTAVDVITQFNALLTRMRNLGLIAT